MGKAKRQGCMQGVQGAAEGYDKENTGDKKDNDNEKAGEILTGRRGPSFTRSEAKTLFTGKGEP